MKSKLFQWIVPALVLVILVGLIIFEQSKDKALSGFIGEGYQYASTTSSTTIGLVLTNGVASSTRILAANDARRYAMCINSNKFRTSSVAVSIMFGSTATTSSPNARALWPAGTTSSTPAFFELTGDNPFTGAVYAYASATSSIDCIEN